MFRPSTDKTRTRSARLRRLRCDRLEDRTVPSTIGWDGGPTGNGTNWLDPVNWVGDVLPGTADDVTISNTGSNPGISLGGTTAVNSVMSSRALSVGGSLTLSGITSSIYSLTMTGTLSAGGTVNI